MIRGLREAHRYAFGSRPRRGKVPAPVKPLAIQAEYLNGLRRGVLDPLRKRFDEVLEGVRSLLAERGDGVRLDGPADKARTMVEKIAQKMSEDVGPAQMARLAERIGKRTSDFQRDQLKRQIKSAVGVDPLLQDSGKLAAKVEDFTAENVSLIKSISTEFFGDIEKRVVAGVRAGTRFEDLADDLEDRYGIAENRAALIARDQVGKFFGELNRTRQEGLGITGYTWRGVGDNREREEHVEREGDHFEWDDPPEDGHPGMAVNCRCWAEPDLEEILSGLE